MPVKAIPQMTAYEKMYNEAASHTGLFDQKQWTYAALSPDGMLTLCNIE